MDEMHSSPGGLVDVTPPTRSANVAAFVAIENFMFAGSLFDWCTW